MLKISFESSPLEHLHLSPCGTIYRQATGIKDDHQSSFPLIEIGRTAKLVTVKEIWKDEQEDISLLDELLDKH